MLKNKPYWLQPSLDMSLDYRMSTEQRMGLHGYALLQPEGLYEPPALHDQD